MEMVEIAQLYKHIKAHYPFFDATVEKVKADHRYLRDFPAPIAWENIARHIQTETVTPGIAHIRGKLGELLESKRSRELAAEHEENLRIWSGSNAPPPKGYWEDMRAKLRGEA